MTSLHSERGRKIRSFLEEDGSTLVEVMVAMALLLSVALPAGMFLGYLAHYPINGEKIRAMGIAQSAMETMLQHDRFVQKSEVEQMPGRWALERKQLLNAGWVYLEVTVYRHGKALVSFSTVRQNEIVSEVE